MENLEENSGLNANSEGTETDIKQLVLHYLRYWPWFILSVIICLAGAYLYLRYTTPVYSASTQVKILDEKDNGGIDLSGLQGTTSLFNISKIKLGNEIQIMKSRRMMRKVIKDLNLNTSYATNGTIKEVPIFKNNLPFQVEWIKEDSTKIHASSDFELRFKNASEFKIYNDNFTSGNLQFLDTIKLPQHQIVVKYNPSYNGNLSSVKGNTYKFHYTSTEALVNYLTSIITIVPIGQQSDILSASITGPNKAHNEDILNSLIDQFNQDGIKDKQLISKRTEEFVKERLAYLYEDLDTVESNIVNYKERNNLVTIENNTQQLMGKETAAEKQRFDISTQIAIAKQFEKTLKSSDDYSLLPANLGINSGGLGQLTDSYNQAVLRRNELLISATEDNPQVKNIDQNLDRLQANIFQNIDSYQKSQHILLENLEQRQNMSSNGLKKIPEQEKQIRTIERQQKIKEKLYLFLLQRREAAALQYATTSPTVKVVDYAHSGGKVSPKSNMILLGGLVLGLIFPVVFIYGSELLDNKIKSKEQVKKIIQGIPIVAEIPQLRKNIDKLIGKNDRSVLAEAFRILRTNIAYFQSPDRHHAAQEGQVVYVTSTTKGEGKTFAAINLAITLASTNKKTLVIGCDLRNPQIHNYINKDKNYAGVSNYLYDGRLHIEDFLLKNTLGSENLDVVLSGEIPPNPAELLLNGRFEMLLEEAKKKYDFVVVDTAPTVLVTDTLLISELADVTLYMVRAGVTETKLLGHIKELKRDKKLKNVGVVINGVESKSGYGYNYGYGYGYSEDKEKRSPFKFWKK